MTELLPPPEMTLERVAEALRDGFAVSNGGARQAHRTFYDTFDGLLRAERLELVHEDGRLTLTERGSGREHATIKLPRPGRAMLVGEIPPGGLQRAVETVCGVRALLPLVDVHSRVRTLSVLDDERKTVVRMTLEQPALLSENDGRPTLRPRVRIIGVRGYDEELDRLQRRLEHELGFTAADQPLVDEAALAAGLVPGGTPAKIKVSLSYNQRADEAAVLVLRRLLEVIRANINGAVEDIDTEFLHDLRVSVRRSRAVQRELRGVFPPAELARFRSEFRWFQRASGEARDLDVYVLEFERFRAMVPDPIRSDLGPLLGVLRARRRSAHREMCDVLRSPRTARLLSDWSEFLEQLGDRSADERPDAARPIGAVAGARIGKLYRRMAKMGASIQETSSAEQYHDLRKQGKELRYLLELFASPLYPRDVVGPMVRTLKDLQDVLGAHQDREVQIATLRSLSDDVAALPRGAAALMAMGVLVDRLGADERAARRAFTDRFAAFTDQSQRKLVKGTFG